MFRVSRWLRWLALLAVWPLPGWSIDSLNLSVGDLAGPGWALSGITVELQLAGAPTLATTLRVRRGRLPEPIGTVDGLSLSCAALVWNQAEIHCPLGKVSLVHPLFDKPAFELSFHFRRDGGRLEVGLHGLAVFDGSADLRLTQNGDGWRAVYDLRGLDIAKAAPWLSLPEPWTVAGRLTAKGEALGVASSLRSLGAKGEFRALGVQNAAGTVATEGLVGGFQVELRAAGDQLTGSGEVSVAAGAAYVDPIYLDIKPAAPLRLVGQYAFDPDHLQVRGLTLTQTGILDAAGDLDVDFNPVFAVRSANLKANVDRLADVGATFINPYLVAGPLEAATWEGAAQLRLDLQGKDGYLEANVRNFGLRDRLDHLRVKGLDGQFRWNLDGSPAQSWLFWKELGLYGLAFGGARLDMEVGSRSARLLRPAEFSLFDGALRVNELEWEDKDDQGPAIHLDALIRPVSLERITEALGVTRFAGTLSAVIPNVRLQNRLWSVNGALLLKAFDGDVVIRGLRVDKLLGPLPILEADVELKHLDLEALTRTFAFGKITGRIEGYARGLHLEGWQPVSFDARLATAEGDDSRHRISQRAVDTLTNVGGSGVAGALSRTYLGFFEDFGYDRIGLSCRLVKGICEMGGVLPADNGGYYIVKGGGLPRIDIVGFNRRVDWDVFLSQLRSAASAGSPDIR